ncbi:DeoR/GlpR family DNA-binding transcription regulator [Vreelandella neptunia]|uniref:DeoR/GlpR family DNA-binding transcription regulator n=1 Tax=Vreelandella neptunia TaxID=115551 RepID=A0ABZ0YQY5_9GAMM|nr:DeoR/GlpR family DNA-binding transcription regulator [Halomonas neptunia]MDN3558883.1 DeoR/GlpR family DNA-binding transcription regulator [Halomonas neptunia]TDV98179.1 DeoR family transcriptional regulator [Halomonas alkaliantarctica]WQH13849.1 DeoR/GlpR family DNA-binding transcription regulator [Halomonas neptunia]
MPTTNGRSALRLAKLQEALASGGTLHLRDAAELCDVSEMTIRRDLSTQKTTISLLGGRLVMANYPGVTPIYDLNEQQASHYQAKHRLCQRALAYIQEGDTLFIDCGSTLMPLLSQLSHFHELTVVTYALNVANAVAALPNVRLVLLGGLFYAASQSFGSDNMAAAVERLGINKALISAAGVDLERGVSCFHFHEVAPKQAAIATAIQRLLVVDASKFGVVRPAYFAALDDFDVVVTDEEGAPQLLDGHGSDVPKVTVA